MKYNATYSAIALLRGAVVGYDGAVLNFTREVGAVG